MKRHYRKMIAPLIITILFVIYYLVYFGVLLVLLDTFWKYVLGIIPITLAAVMIAVCYDRIKEIRSGEEDDLSKY